MKPYRELGSLVFWLIVLPGFLGFTLFYLEHRALADEVTSALAVVSLLIVMSAPGFCPKPDKGESDTSLFNIKRRSAGSVGALAMVAIMTFPDATAQLSQFLDFGISLGVLALFSLGSVLFGFATLSHRKADRSDFWASIFKALVGAFFTAVFLGSLQGLTEVQVLWLFAVVLGVFTNLVWPNNKRLAEAIVKAEPLERRVLRIVERISFALGVTVIVIVAAIDRTPTLADFLGTAMIIGFCHWLLTRNRDVYYGMQK